MTVERLLTHYIFRSHTQKSSYSYLYGMEVLGRDLVAVLIIDVVVIDMKWDFYYFIASDFGNSC